MGTVFIALAGADGEQVLALHLDGDRHAIREECVSRMLALLIEYLTS